MSRWQNLTLNQIAKNNNKFLINHSLKNQQDLYYNNIIQQKNIKHNYINKNLQKKHKLLLIFLNLNQKNLKFHIKYFKFLSRRTLQFNKKWLFIKNLLNYYYLFFSQAIEFNQNIINFFSDILLTSTNSNSTKNKYQFYWKQLLTYKLPNNLKLINYNSFIIISILQLLKRQIKTNKYWNKKFITKYIFYLLIKYYFHPLLHQTKILNHLNIFLFDLTNYQQHQNEIKIINKFYYSWFNTSTTNINLQKLYFFLKVKYFELIKLRDSYKKVWLNNLYLNKTLNLSLNIIEDYLYYIATPTFLNKKTRESLPTLSTEWVRNVILFSLCFNNINLLGRLILFLISHIKRPQRFLIILKEEIDLIFKLLWKNYSLINHKFMKLKNLNSSRIRHEELFMYYLRTYFYYFRQLRSIILQVNGRFNTTSQASTFLTKTGLLMGYRRKKYKNKYLYFFNTTHNILGAYGIKIWFII